MSVPVLLCLMVQHQSLPTHKAVPLQKTWTSITRRTSADWFPFHVAVTKKFKTEH